MVSKTIQPIDYTIIFRTIVLDWLIIGVLIGITFHYIYLYPITALLIAGRINGLGVIAHDLCHQPIRKKSFLFIVCEVLSGYPVNTTVEAMAYHHLNHHRYSNTKRDPYFETKDRSGFFSQIKFILVRGFLLPFGWLIRPFFGVVAHLVPKLRKPYAKAFLRALEDKDYSTDEQVAICAKNEWFLLPFSTALIVGAFISNYVIYFYFIPAFISGIFSICRLVAEHTNEEFEHHSKQSVLKSTFDNHHSLLDRVFISPHSIGYHVAHHIYPTVPSYQLKKVTQDMRNQS